MISSRTLFTLSRAAFQSRLTTPLSTYTMSTISEAIKEDHRELEEYYNEIINSNDHDHQQRFGNQFTWELARHSVGEELVLYPAMEKYLGAKGIDLAEHDRKEHHQVSQVEFNPLSKSKSDQSKYKSRNCSNNFRI